MMPAASRGAGFPRRGRGASCFLLLLWLTAPAFAVDVRPDLWATNGPVYAIAVDAEAGLLYLGGDFTEVGPADPLAPRVARTRLAAFDLDSGAVTGWDPSADGAVYAMRLSADGETLYIGGDFSGVGGQERNRLAALDTVVGVPRTAWNPGADGAVRAMIPSASGNTLYIAGSFGTVANASRRGLAEVGMLGNSGITGLGQTALFEAGADLRALALGANRLYVGGTFVVADTDQDDEPQRLAAVDLSTFRLAANWMPAIDDGEVRALHHLPDQNVVYAGGSFTGIGGSPRAGIAAFNAQNGELLTWNPQLAGAVDTLARSLDRTALYLGGQFNAIAGVPRTNLAAVSTINAAVLGDWEVAVDGGVFSFATAEDAAEESYVLYAGGAFTAIDASPRSGLAALTALAPEREPPLTVANPPGRFFNSNDVATAGQNCNDDDIPLPPGQPDCGGVDLPVALLCDDSEGAGCAATYYTLDGSEPDADSPRYVAPISVRVDTVLKFFSVDHVGNAGAVSSEVYTFETDPPRTSVDPPSRVFEEGRLEIRLSCTDTGSGCAATYYTLDGSRPTVNSLRYTGPIVITGDAVLQYFSVDVAGNAEGVRRSDYVDNRGEVGAFGLELLLMLPAAAVAAARRTRREHG